MNDKEFKQMIDSLMAQEEKNLQVNSKEFNQRHEELMQLIRRVEGAEKVSYMELVLDLIIAHKVQVRDFAWIFGKINVNATFETP